MMRERLKNAAATPQFKTLLMVGVQHMVSAARTLSLVGIDVTDLMEEAIRSCQKQLNEAAYELTNLDELLNHAQAMGDEVAQKERPERPISGETSANQNSSEGDFGKSD